MSDRDDAELEKTQLLTTKGIESQVIEDGERVGHILLADYDNGVDDEQIQRDIDSLDGLTLVFESSPNSWHLWNLVVRERDETALRLLDLRGADAKHIAIGWRYGKWTLRTGPKTDYNGKDHTDAPELVTAAWNQTDRPHSLAHLRFARALHDISDLPFPIQTVGDAMSLSQYQTITDELKQEVWGNG